MPDKWWSEVLRKHTKPNTAENILKTLKLDLGVKLLAFDFDRTLIDFNTHGKWKDSIEKLASHVRPCFKELIGEVLRNGGLKLCIVTFSIQPELISQVLKHLFPNFNTDEIIIEYNTQNIKPQLSLEVYKVGKQKHLNKVIKRIQNNCGMVIKPNEIFLFDDRRLYVKIARKSNVYAYLVNDDVSLQKVNDYLQQLTNNEQIQHRTTQNAAKQEVNDILNAYPYSSFINIPAWTSNLEAKYGIKMATNVVPVK